MKKIYKSVISMILVCTLILFDSNGILNIYASSYDHIESKKEVQNNQDLENDDIYEELDNEENEVQENIIEEDLLQEGEINENLLEGNNEILGLPEEESDLYVKNIEIESSNGLAMELSFDIKAYKYDIYVNDQLYMSDFVYGSNVENYMDEEKKVNLVFLYELDTPQTTYNVKIIPYNTNDEAGAEANYSYTTLKTTISDFAAVVYDENNYQGYGLKAVLLNWNYQNAYSAVQYEIYRSNSKDGEYVLVDKCKNTGTYLDESAIGNETYYYKIRAIYEETPYAQEWTSEYTNVVFVDNKTHTDISIDTDNGKGIKISLSSNMAISGYEIYRSTKKNSGFTKIAVTAYTNYTDASIEIGKTYYYKARSYFYNRKDKKNYYGVYSDVVGMQYNIGKLNATGTRTGTNSYKITWNKVDSATGYYIFCKSKLTGNVNKKIFSTTSANSYTVNDLDDTIKYTFSVRAYKKVNGVLDCYTSSDLIADFNKLETPTVKIVKRTTTLDETTSKITIQTGIRWSKIYNATGYKLIGVYKENNIEKEKEIKNFSADTFEYLCRDIKGITDNYVGYRYYLEVYNETEKIRTYLFDETYSCGNIKSCSAEVFENYVQLKWEPSSCAEYYIVYRTAPNGVETSNVVNDTKFKDYDITPGVEYSYKIVGYNSEYHLSASNNFGPGNNSVTAMTFLGAPVISNITNTSKNTARIYFSKVNGSTSYEIYRKTGSGTYVKIATSYSNYYVDADVKKGTKYNYRIKAVTKNGAGITVKSNPSAIVGITITK